MASAPWAISLLERKGEDHEAIHSGLRHYSRSRPRIPSFGSVHSDHRPEFRSDSSGATSRYGAIRVRGRLRAGQFRMAVDHGDHVAERERESDDPSPRVQRTIGIEWRYGIGEPKLLSY